jgi:carbon-monoxide dehydrogenase small subunit
MSRKIVVQTQINGEDVEFLCEPRQTLLDVLRETLGLMGTKEGCSNGNCGACNVILDGVLVNSCLVLAAEAEGKTIVTIEGIAPPGALHPLQQAFLEEAALQCGVCTPGFIVAAKALLDQNPQPTEGEVRRWLAGNLCRCTGYDKIVRAVLLAARPGGAASVDIGQPAGAASGGAQAS